MKSTYPHIAVVGAGLAGAVLTSHLLQAGMSVTLFDKSRGTGGRLASCRLGDQVADLGAPLFEIDPGAFCDWLQQQPEISRWQPKRSDFSGESLKPEQYFVVSPRQSALTRRLIQGAEFIPQLRVGSLWPERVGSGQGVVLRDEHGKAIGHYDAVVVATPARQAVALLEALPRFMHRAAAVATFPRWVQVLEIPAGAGPRSELILGEHPQLLRVCHNSHKPGRIASAESEVWVLEANEQWSAEYCDAPPAQISASLKAAFSSLLPASPKVISERTHRWLYARHEGLGEPFLWDERSAIGACGDWLAVGELRVPGEVPPCLLGK